MENPISELYLQFKSATIKQCRFPKKTVGLLFIFILFFLSDIAAQPAFKFTDGLKPVKLKFELHRNLIIIQTKLNGKGPYNFLLDTGVNTSIITNSGLIDSLNLIRGPKVDIAGLGEGTDLHAFFSPGVKVEMPGIVADKITFAVLSEDILQLGNYVGEPVHGILGFDFFNSFIVRFNFNTLSIILYPQGEIKLGTAWQKLPLKLEDNKPYIFSELSYGIEYFPVKLLVDTGAGHALSLETQSDKRLKIPEKNMPSQLGMGLSGPVNGCIGRVPKFRLGKFEIQNLLASFPDSLSGTAKLTVKRNGNLGLELLKRFNLILDYAGQNMYLKKHDSLQRPFEYDMCGLEIVAVPPKYRTYRITNVHENSPAAEAGILPGDELIALDMLPATSYSLTQISRLFHSRHGREINMLLKRKTELVNVSFKLRRRI